MMRRVLAILKYVPAALCGLLVVAWVVSLFFAFITSIGLPSRRGMSRRLYVALRSGEIQMQDLRYYPDDNRIWRLFGGGGTDSLAEPRHYLGSWAYSFDSEDLWIRLPIPMLLAFLIPIAIGFLIEFRFPLWSYFAWTALVAVELAYYLR